MHRIGLLSSGRPPGGDAVDPYLAALIAALRELGYTEGTNLKIEPRRAGGDLYRLPALAAELVALNVEVILAGGNPAVDAARRATQTIPIVMVSSDPVRAGFVQSLSRPGGNLTGLSIDAGLAVWGKRLQLLKEAAPQVSRVAVLSRTGGRQGAWVPILEEAAHRLGFVLLHAGAKRSEDFVSAFAAMSARQPDALIAGDTPLNLLYRKPIIEFAALHRLPDIHGYREAAEDGALMSYGFGIDMAAVYRQAASYIDRILRGAIPGDLPIQQPTQFSLAINLKTAAALGLTIPPSLLVRADRIIA
jgi:putative ABC transport system substrate-binding protein